jgi:hypothetical protein
VSNCHAHTRNDEGLGSGFRIGERNGWGQGWLYNYNSMVAGYRLTSVWRGKVQAGTPVQLHKKGEMMPLWHHPTHTFTAFSACGLRYATACAGTTNWFIYIFYVPPLSDSLPRRGERAEKGDLRKYFVHFTCESKYFAFKRTQACGHRE